MQKLLLILPVSLLALSSCISTNTNMEKVSPNKEIVTEKTIPENAMMRKEPTMVKPENAMMRKEPSKENIVTPSQWYMSYSSDAFSSALKSKQNVVLFFSATWCPTCRALDKQIESNLSSIPSDAVILKVNYDDSTELKQKYGVTTQHTTVLIGSDGSFKSKKLWARNISEIFAQ